MALHLVITVAGADDFASMDSADATLRPHVIANLNNKTLKTHIASISQYDGFVIHDTGLPTRVALSLDDDGLEAFLISREIRPEPEKN